MALDSVSAFIVDARVLLQDVDAPQRYGDTEMTAALDRGIMDMRRLRPDLFITITSNFTVPLPSASSAIPSLDPQYRTALLYYLVGQMQLRDDEPTQDQRAAMFMDRFRAQLLTVSA